MKTTFPLYALKALKVGNRNQDLRCSKSKGLGNKARMSYGKLRGENFDYAVQNLLFDLRVI